MLENGHDVYDFEKMKKLAEPHWRNLNQDEKHEFAEKSLAELRLGMRRKKMTFNGLELEEYLEQSFSRKKTHKVIIPEIERIVEKNLSNLDDLVFHVISTSNFGDEKDVCPAEIAIAKFSLHDGIIDFFNILVKPGKLSNAFRNKAQKKAESLRLNSSLDEDDESDYYDILSEILIFLSPLENLPIFFADEDVQQGFQTLKESQEILTHIMQQVQEDVSIPLIKIYPVKELFNILKKFTCGNRNPDKKMFENIHMTPGCDTHNDQNAAYYCCLSKVRRICYTIFKWCCDDTTNELKLYGHYPMIKTEEKQRCGI